MVRPASFDAISSPFSDRAKRAVPCARSEPVKTAVRMPDIHPEVNAVGLFKQGHSMTPRLTGFTYLTSINHQDSECAGRDRDSAGIQSGFEWQGTCRAER
jgi:hypothetical protein